MAKITPDDIRAARAFLRKRGVGTSEIPPRTFAFAAREMKKSFSDLLRFIARLYQGRTDQSMTRREILMKERR